MPSFQYEKSLGHGKIRLLRLLKGHQDPIQCELFEAKLDPAEQIQHYIALSYTWGSESTPCDIMINRMEVDVTINVYLALQDLRLEESDRLLWVDALSINQSDEREKSQQVQQMASIFKNAESVIIWLGPATYEMNYLMNHVQQVERQSVKSMSGEQKDPDAQWREIWADSIQTLRESQQGVLRKGLQLLLRREWFRRVWILQETAHARAAEVFCGRKSILASTLTRLPSFLKLEPENHCKSILEILPGPRRYCTWWTETRDLRTLLNKFRASDATLPQDKIYALFGISSDADDVSFPRANYEESIQDVVFNTASFILKLNRLDPPVSRFFDWTLQEFFKKLSVLATEVLLSAAKTGNAAVVKVLLETQADVGLESQLEGRTPLLWAAMKGHDDIVKMLLEAGADVEAKDQKDNRTSLLWAAANGYEGVVGLLLEAKANTEVKDRKSGRTPLSWAAGSGHDAVVKLLLGSKADVEARSGGDGWTPLSWAALIGHETVVKLLLDGKADIESRSYDDNRTPLSWAAESGHVAVVKLLLEAGADIESRSRHDGRTPLSWAAASGHEGVISGLLENKADVKARSRKEHWTPLSWALENGHNGAVDMLLAVPYPPP